MISHLYDILLMDTFLFSVDKSKLTIGSHLLCRYQNGNNYECWLYKINDDESYVVSRY